MGDPSRFRAALGARVWGWGTQTSHDEIYCDGDGDVEVMMVVVLGG